VEELTGRTAVVTGAASGIGRAMVQRFAAEGMRVVLADIEPDALAQATHALVAGGAEAIGVPTDVTDISSVQALSNAARDRFGNIHVLCNNAGVGPPAEPQLWLNTPNDWRWTFEVNVFGVVNGLNVFMPHMVEPVTSSTPPRPTAASWPCPAPGSTPPRRPRWSRSPSACTTS
jgi:NAD(P)-dependent dehydrogenase (short-subunit alcohol dehydrogenase family)